MSQNLKAFLDTIAWSEIGRELLAASDDGYNVLVGSTAANPKLFTSYADHPHVRDDEMNSDAAGRYQIMGRFWVAYKPILKLPDFGHASQDAFALQLIRECRALDDIDAGRISIALDKCRSRWASLPGAGYGQHEQKLDNLIAAYQTAGGLLA